MKRELKSFDEFYDSVSADLIDCEDEFYAYIEIGENNQVDIKKIMLSKFKVSDVDDLNVATSTDNIVSVLKKVMNENAKLNIFCISKYGSIEIVNPDIKFKDGVYKIINPRFILTNKMNKAASIMYQDDCETELEIFKTLGSYFEVKTLLGGN